MTHIFTHNDLDGYAAGYVILQALKDKKVKITHLNYDKEPALEDIKSGDTVFITDYSLTNDQYRQILELVGDEGHLIWCDHHISAIERYEKDEELCLEGIRSTKYCGALLTWCYFNDIDAEEINDIYTYQDICDRVPDWLLMVDAWDTWKLDSEYRRAAELLNLAVANILSDDIMPDIVTRVRDYIKIGRYYEAYRNQWAKSFRDKYMFKKEMSGAIFGVDRQITVASMNIGCANSTFFGEVVDEVDVCMTQCFDGEKWTVSLYSNKKDIDCAKAATSFGGGGHKGAAGYTVETLYPHLFLDSVATINQKSEEEN